MSDNIFILWKLLGINLLLPEYNHTTKLSYTHWFLLKLRLFIHVVLLLSSFSLLYLLNHDICSNFHAIFTDILRKYELFLTKLPLTRF